MFVVKKADVSKPARKGAGKAAVHDKDVVRTSAGLMHSYSVAFC